MHCRCMSSKSDPVILKGKGQAALDVAGWRIRAELCGLDASQPLERRASPCAGLALGRVWLRLCRTALHSWLAKSQRFPMSVETGLLAARGMQCPLDASGIARNDGEVGFVGGHLKT